MSETVEDFRLGTGAGHVITVLVAIFAATLCYLVTFKTDPADIPRAMLPMVYALAFAPVGVLYLVMRRLRRLGFVQVGPDGLLHGLSMRGPVPWDRLDRIMLEVRTHAPSGLQNAFGQTHKVLHLCGEDLRAWSRFPLRDPGHISGHIAGLRGKGDPIAALVASIERFKPVERGAP